jgi:paraquat-inducible protein A
VSPVDAVAGMGAREQGLIGCRDCFSVLQGAAGDRCPRCRARVHARRPDSTTRTRAWLLTSVLLYVPANVLPMTHRETLGRAKSETLLESIVNFIQYGDWMLAIVVFVASVTIPLVKILLIGWISIEALRPRTRAPLDRVRLLRFADGIGRWSMIDVYVVAMLSALVQLGVFAEIRPGLGAACFGAVVISTLCASRSVEPRLLWDRAGPDRLPESPDA